MMQVEKTMIMIIIYMMELQMKMIIYKIKEFQMFYL